MHRNHLPRCLFECMQKKTSLAVIHINVKHLYESLVRDRFPICHLLYIESTQSALTTTSQCQQGPEYIKSHDLGFPSKRRAFSSSGANM